MGSDKVCRTNFAVKTLCVLLAFTSISNIMTSFGRGVRTRGGRGYKPGTISRYRRFDNNIFTVLSDEVAVQDGAVQDADHTDLFTATSDNDDDFVLVRGKQSKRQRISSSGQSGPIDQPSHDGELSDHDFIDYIGMTSEQKLSLILSKVSVNESRVYTIQNKLDSILNIKSRVASIENVVKSQHDRLKLLEYRSLDLEARCRRKNLVFKGFPENRHENCFEEIRRFICEKLRIDRDMYLERAHRLGRYNIDKNRPIIVAFRDFCDTEEILNACVLLKDTGYGISRDYPNEISKARQTLWKQYKTTRDANPTKKLCLDILQEF